MISSEISHVWSSIDRLESKDKTYYSWSETVNYLGITDKDLQKLLEQSDLPYLKVNERYIFHKAPLDAWLLNKANKFSIKNTGS